MLDAMLRKRRLWLGVGALALLVAAAIVVFCFWQWPRLAPFDAVRWNGSIPEVRVEGQWYELLAIDDIPAADIVAHCERRYRYEEMKKKRFSEDLVEVLAGMWRWPGRTVDLGVRRLDDGQVVTLRDVPMTEENRNAVWRYNQRAEWLQPLRASDILRDLDELARVLRERYSYLQLKGFDWEGAIAAVRARAAEGMTRGALALELQGLIARFGDGHSQVDASLDEVLSDGHAPFLAEHAEGKLVAFLESRAAFVDPEHPFLTEIDGLDVTRWLEAVGTLAPGGSPQLIRRHAARGLRDVGHLRSKLGLPASGEIELTLASRGGETKKVSVGISPRRPRFGDWPRSSTRLLDGGIGYLRISEMTDDRTVISNLHRAMDSFRSTRGLVIDVRGNGGGTRDILRELFPYFLRDGDPPRIANVAAYRLPPEEARGNPEGYLSNRFLYPATWSGWSAGERAEIERFAAGFRPAWVPPKDDFSEWHYLIISPAAGGRRPHYDRPVVVLMDSGCFSATDIFLGAFKGWRNVTLMGTPSGGGSGRVRTYRLPSGLQVRLSTMASFQPDGRLYDGIGVQPDVVAEPVATDLIGSTDSVLAAAVARLGRG